MIKNESLPSHDPDAATGEVSASEAMRQALRQWKVKHIQGDTGDDGPKARSGKRAQAR